MPKRPIELRGVRVHNLKALDLEIPAGQMLAICGVSGSGKSSLAFDTLFAEGQRRYFESLSPYTRQYLEQLDKPDAESIEGIPPSIAIRAQRATISNGGRIAYTVGTASEVAPLLRLLFAKIAQPFCPDCNALVDQHTVETVKNFVQSLHEGIKFQIGFGFDANRVGGRLQEELKSQGYRRIVLDGKSSSLDEIPADANWTGKTVNVIVDRLIVEGLPGNQGHSNRLAESIETAFQGGGGKMLVLWEKVADGAFADQEWQIDDRVWHYKWFSKLRLCSECGKLIPDPIPQTFDRAGQLGACEACRGQGLAETAGSKNGNAVCKHCRGSGLNANALSFRLGGLNIWDLCQFEISSLATFLDKLNIAKPQQKIADAIIQKISERLKYLAKVGLSYMSLNRQVTTLSSGELQRVVLTKALGTTLTNLLYVLDEPSSGLHSSEVNSLIEATRDLNKRGNTVVVVDHDEAMIMSADRIVEIGPGAGNDGGTVVFDGTPAEIVESESCTTGKFVAVRAGLRDPGRPRRSLQSWLKLRGANGNNLQNIDVDFPLGCFCVVSGVSGSGKSSLVSQTLAPAVVERLELQSLRGLPYSALDGYEQLDEIALIDQLPIGRSSRSNPVTYIKAFDDIRKAFAETTEARLRNFSAGHFSFNVDDGRCEKCRGQGQLTIDMHFMADVHTTCDHCQGTRFRKSILDVKYRAKNVHEVLNMTAREAFAFFRGKKKVQSRLKALIDVGLDYIRLGQPATTLSSGEAQRLKLAHYLNAPKSRRVLFVMEEPTFGLHPQDILKLVDCFDTLIAAGHSLIVVEHSLHLIKHSDWMIDLGPGASKHGGRIVAAGTPEDIANCQHSQTAGYLRRMMDNENKALAAFARRREN